MEKKRKRGRPKGSKNKKGFFTDNIAKSYADLWIVSYHIDFAEALAVKILEKIRANKARLNEKYPPQ